MKKHPMLVSALIANILPVLFFFIIFLSALLRKDHVPFGIREDAFSLLIKLSLFLLLFCGLGGFFSVWLFRYRSNLPITPGQGIRAGALCGLLTWLINSYPFIWISRDSLMSYEQFMAFFLYIFVLPLSVLLGLVGGLIGGLIFRTRAFPNLSAR